MTALWSTLVAYLAANSLETAGMIVTLSGIWLTTRRLLLCWPITLLADFLYLAIFFRARLYSDTLLQLFFIAFTLYGWWHWWRGVRAEGEVRIEPLPLSGWLNGLIAGALGSLLLGWLMTRVGAALPHLDATLAAYSLVASWWGARKHIANWALWIAVDSVYIGEYIYKGLYLTALLYALLVVLALLGLRNWSRAPQSTPHPAPQPAG
jgi:nicotinamide mononucleotide transporter